MKNLFTRLLDNIKINEHTDCWEWQLSTNNIGYGFIRDGNRMRTVHRVSYELHNDTTIPKHMCVCHTCDNPICVNPKHLWLGTHKDNTDDMIKKNRQNFGWKTKPTKGIPKPRVICSVCNRSVTKNVLHKYHEENCKGTDTA